MAAGYKADNHSSTWNDVGSSPDNRVTIWMRTLRTDFLLTPPGFVSLVFSYDMLEASV